MVGKHCLVIPCSRLLPVFCEKALRHHKQKDTDRKTDKQPGTRMDRPSKSGKTVGKINRQTNTADRQTGRTADRQTGRQSGRQSLRQANGKAEGQTDKIDQVYSKLLLAQWDL